MGMTREQALLELATFVNADQYPVIDSVTLGTFLDDYVRYGVWTASTSYSVGDRIVPVVPNGRIYECRVPGTSAATEPAFAYYNSYTGWYIAENVSNPCLTWVDVGPANTERYDTRSAARAIWIYKAGFVANQVDVSETATDVSLSQLQKQFLAMAERYRPMVVYV
jgi:hypothetical protein